MTLYVLDTDHISLHQKDHQKVTNRINSTAPENLAVTIVSAEEQFRGWFNAIRQAKSGERLHWAYLGLRQGIEYFNTVRILDMSQEATDLYLDFRSSKIRIGKQDLRIASVVVSVNGVLVTRNRRDFEQVPGLIIEDWS